MTKSCTRCGGTKPASDFSTQPSRKDGLSSWCRPCLAENTRSYRADPAYRLSQAVGSARRRADRYGVEHVPYTVADLVRLWGPIGTWWCVYCGRPATGLDHVVPMSKGGADSLANVVPACGGQWGQGCNSSKGRKDLAEWLASSGTVSPTAVVPPDRWSAGLTRLVAALSASDTDDSSEPSEPNE